MGPLSPLLVAISILMLGGFFTFMADGISTTIETDFIIR